MKRWLVLIFALLLPVQFAWAGAAAYCQHETTPAQTRHFGHHAHVHEASAETGTSKVAGDNDCATCHVAGSPVLLETSTLNAVVLSSAGVVPHRLRLIPTALARAPDRPQWLRLA